MRSKRKGPVIFTSTHSTRHASVTPSMIGKTFNIHVGNKTVEVTVIEEMLGHKLGEFTRTRAEYIFKKKKRKK